MSNSEPSVVRTAAGLAVVFCAYLWFRAIWLLQQCGVQHPGRRLVFLLFVLPAALFLNCDAAYSMLVVLAIFFGEPPHIAVLLFSLTELFFATKLLHYAMLYVLGDKATATPVEVAGARSSYSRSSD